MFTVSVCKLFKISKDKYKEGVDIVGVECEAARQEKKRVGVTEDARCRLSTLVTPKGSSGKKTDS